MTHDSTIYALLYCRVSSQRQKEEGGGLESQEFRCRERARQKGYAYEKTFLDSFTGGGDFMKRPAMRELLADIDGNPDKRYVVIFDDLKRFARDVIFHWKLRQEFQARNVLVECLNFNFEDTPEGAFIETVLAAQGELERKQNRRQVIQKQKARLERGYWPFFAPPGYRHSKDSVHGKLLVLTEPAAGLIKHALEGFASGRFPEQTDVQRFLQRGNFNDGKPVYLEAVKRLLTRVLYTGYIEYPAWDVARRQGHHAPLISLATYERIQERLRGTVKTFARKDVNEDFPLRGFVLCSTCRAPYTASWSRGRNATFPYYRCKTKGCGQQNKSVPRSALEDHFEIILKRLKPRPQMLDLTKAICLRVWQEKSGDGQTVRARCQAELVQIRQEIAALADRAARASNETVASAYERRITELATRELVVKEQEEKIEPTSRQAFGTALGTVFDILKDPDLQWENGDIHDRRLLLRLLFSEKLAYDRQMGFGTAGFSLPVALFQMSTGSRFQLVEMVRNSWNQLFTFIFESQEMLRSRERKIDWRDAA